MPRITTNQIAMGVGTSGAMTDVSTYVLKDKTVTYLWGTQDPFRPVVASQWTFTLDNSDGRFTPGNQSSPWATKVIEGMQVSWMLGSRLLCGSILSILPVFDGDVAGWARVQITVDDGLGVAARTNMSASLADSISQGAGQYAFFPMDGDQNTVYATDTVGNLGNLALQFWSASMVTASPAVAFGQPPVTGLPNTQVLLTAISEQNYFICNPTGSNILYSQTSLGCWGFWLTPNVSTVMFFQVWVAGLASPFEFDCSGGGTSIGLTPGTGTAITGAITLAPHYISWSTSTTFAAGAWTITCTLYVDGVSVGTSTYTQASGSVTSLTNAQRQPSEIAFRIGDNTNVNSVVIGRLAHTAVLSHEELALGTTEALRLKALDSVVPAMTLDTLPADLSMQPIGFNTPSGSVLDELNLVMLTEQGYVWSAATGTLLSPTPLVRVRARNRPSTVTCSFDIERELSGAPSFTHDLANMLARVDVTGPNGVASFFDGTVSGQVGSASGQETILNSFSGDVEAWAQDRLYRGKNVNMRIISVVVDAMTTPTDRSSDLLSLRPGDRVRFTNQPVTQMGFTTWDGWLIGGVESHTVEAHKFTLFFAPVMALQAALYDTAVFDDAGELSLSASITNVAVSASVATSGALLTSTVPFTIQIDSEQMTVTAISGSGPQPVTITRGVNGTTAAAHTAGATVSFVGGSTFVF